jgi:hypothetical protein
MNFWAEYKEVLGLQAACGNIVQADEKPAGNESIPLLRLRGQLRQLWHDRRASARFQARHAG